MTYHAEKARHFSRSPLGTGSLRGSVDGIYNFPRADEIDAPLDAFDQQLLSELPRDSPLRASQGLSPISLRPRHQNVSNMSNTLQMIRDDLYETPTRYTSSLIPVPEPLSSPIVSALQNERSHNEQSKVNHRHESANARQAGTWSDAPLLRPYLPGNTAPALNHTTPMVRGIQLVPISRLPDQISSIFSYKLLNAIQSKCFPAAFHTDDNLVLSAPTGSGKTLVMELAICRLLHQNRNGDFKVVYQAPTKALCAERYRDWKAKFGTLGLECAEFTGNTEHSHLRLVQAARIIITTPEKWDSVTRKWKDQMKLIQLIKLFLVDEVHILKESRGATLEAVVSRMKSIGTDVRFVALSATVPNSEDIATWLGKNRASPELPAHRQVFDESYRPVKLEKYVYGFKCGSNDFISDKVFMKQIPAMIEQHSNGKPTMIFCMTRKSAFTTASNLAAWFNQASDAQKMWARPTKPIPVSDGDLKPLVAVGVAFHHAGVGPDDRIAVEQGFLRGDITVICSTSTLAVGINLPCYLVILQGTMSYGDGGAQEYSDLEVMQMLGRAGRPQFERSACAVVLTREEKVEKYLKMVAGQQVLESTLHRNLIDHLNAEIGLGTIHDTASAKKWLSSTFLYVRLGRNPGYYRLDEDKMHQSQDEVLNRICRNDIDLLINHDCIQQTNRLRSTEIGDAMARYYVKFETMKIFRGIPPKAKMSEILSILSQATEFHEVKFKPGEKAYYKKLNDANGIKFPVLVNIALTAHKVSLLLQAELGGVDNPTGDEFKKVFGPYNLEKNVVFGLAKRLIRCIIDCQLHLKDAVSVKNALELGRSFAGRAWDSTPQQLREIPGVGITYARKLAAGGINSIESFINTEPERIDLVTGKSQPFGRNLLNAMSGFPDLRIAVKEVGREIRSGRGAMLKMKAEVGFINQRVPIFFKSRPVSVIFIAEDSEGTIWDFRRFSAKKIQNGDEFCFIVDLTKPAQHIRCSIMCDEIVGTFRYAEAAVLNIPAAAFPMTINARRLTDVKSGSHNARSSLVNDDFFGNDGVDDGDLLAAGAQSSRIEVVKDIDDYPFDSNDVKWMAQQNRTKAVEKSSRQDEEEYRQPVQLNNGRWTCQHLCNDKGLECKHKCCHNGVVKPKSRPKKQQNSRGNEKGQWKITNMTENARKASSLEQKHVLDLDPLFRLATKNDNLSFGRVPSSHESHHQPSKRQKLSSQSDGGPNGPQISRGRPKPTSLIENGNCIDKEAGPSQAYDFEELQLWNAGECDWNSVEAAARVPEDVKWTEAIACDRKQLPGERLHGQTHVDHDPHNITPPVPFLSLADLERPCDRGLFITGHSSSPVKLAIQNRDTTPATEDSGSSDGMPNKSWIDENDPANWHVSTSNDLGFGPISPRISGFRHPLDEVSPNAAHKPDDFAVSTPIENETPQKSKERRWEADQKLKWEGLDPWLYEQFHNIVELV